MVLFFYVLQSTPPAVATGGKRAKTPILIKSLCVALLLVSSPATAMEFRIVKTDNGAVLVATGEIIDGDAMKFLAFMRDYPALESINTVFLQSPGGSISESKFIGEVIRKFSYNTVVGSDGSCQSACFELWAAGTSRFVGEGAKIGVHRVHVEGRESNETKAITIGYATRLQSFGVPKSVLGALMLQPAASIYTLNDEDLANMHAYRYSRDGKISTAQPVTKPTYQLTYNTTPEAPVEPLDIRGQRRMEFDETFAKAYEVSKRQNRGRAAAKKNCDRNSCEAVLAYLDKNGYYVELHKSLTSDSRALCRLTEPGLFADRYLCKNWLTEKSHYEDWSQDPLLPVRHWPGS